MVINLFGCLLWGISCALALTALCALVATGISGKRTNILIAAVLFVVLSYESVLGAGALYARAYVNGIGEFVGEMTDGIDTDDSEDIADALKDRYPALPDNIVDKVKEATDSVGSASRLADAVTKSVNDSIMSYFWGRVLWGAGLMTVGTLLLVFFAPAKKKRTQYKGYHEEYGSVSYDGDYSTRTTSRSRYSDFE